MTAEGEPVEPDAAEPPKGRGAQPWQASFLDRVAALNDASGLPPSYIRVFAWLVVCDPPEQSVGQIRQALRLSSGAISMATSSLVVMGLVERVVQPGERRQYFRLGAGGWERLLRLRLEAISHMRSIADDALAAAANPPPRLAEMRAIYAWFEERLATLMADQPWRSGN